MNIGRRQTDRLIRHVETCSKILPNILFLPSSGLTLRTFDWHWFFWAYLFFLFQYFHSFSGFFGSMCWIKLAISQSLSSCKYPILHSGRTSVFGQRTFPVLRSTCSWWVTTIVGKPSAICQPTRPTQPFILSGSIKWVVSWNQMCAAVYR